MTGQLTWLVTGCSSGFGEAFVRAILAKVIGAPHHTVKLNAHDLNRVIALSRQHEQMTVYLVQTASLISKILAQLPWSLM